MSRKAFGAQAARIIAISPDSVEQNRGVVERLGLEFAILSDARGEAMDAFGLRHVAGGPGGTDISRPGTFIFEAGRLRWRKLTDNWRVRPRPPELLAALEELAE